MPILQFVGVEASREVILELIDEIPIWVSSVEGLEVDAKYVTPIYVPSIQKNPGECVIFYVQELFTVGLTGKPRTADIRRELSQAIKNGFNAFIAIGKLDVEPIDVMVVTRMVDRDEGEYLHWSVPSKQNKPNIHRDCSMYGSIEHMQSKTGKCPNCGKL